MRKKVGYFVSMALFLGVVFGFVPGLTMGCEEKKKDVCTSNTDCEGDESCVTIEGQGYKDCKKRGDLDDECKQGGPPCLQRGSDGKRLVCDPNDQKCKHECETDLDCDSKDQTCDTTKKYCVKKGPSDGGPPADEPPPSGKKEGEDCGGSAKCESGLDCVTLGNQSDGKCWKTCKADADCSDGKLCSGGHCVPNGDACKGTPGNLTTPCWSGLDCLFESAGEGKCYRKCSKDDECPTGLKCVEQSDKNKYCTSGGGEVAKAGEKCGDIGGKTVGCESGHQCVPERVGATDKICTKECKSDSECTWPRFCEQICTLGTVGSAGLGKVCDPKAGAPADKKCDGGLDCLNLQTGGGLCYRSCKDPRATPCPDGTECVAVGQEKHCLKKCTQASDCAAPTGTCAGLNGATGMFCLHGGN